MLDAVGSSAGLRLRISVAFSSVYPGTPPVPKNKALCFVLLLQGVELARCTRCFTPEDVSGKAEAPDTGADVGPGLGVSFPRQSLSSTDVFLEAAAPTCSLCRRDLRNEGSRLLPCQHLLCRDCSQGFMREPGHVTRVYGAILDGKGKSITSCVSLWVRRPPASWESSFRWRESQNVMPKGYSLLRASRRNSRDKANPLGFVRWGLFIFGVSLSCWQTILFQGLPASIQRRRECALVYVGFEAERERLASWCWNHAELSSAETATRQGGASAFLLNVRFPRRQSRRTVKSSGTRSRSFLSMFLAGNVWDTARVAWKCTGSMERKEWYLGHRSLFLLFSFLQYIHNYLKHKSRVFFFFLTKGEL